MFIELHSHKYGHKVLVNVNKIVAVSECNKDDRMVAVVVCDNEDEWYVAEKYDDIKRQLEKFGN